MKVENKWPISVCTWSLQCKNDELPELLNDLNVNRVHLALAPFLGQDNAAEFINAQSWTISCLMMSFDHEDYATLETIKETGGVVPDEHWETTLTEFREAVDLSKDLNCDLLSFHAGFIDESNDTFEKLCGRIREIADLCQSAGLTLLLETGQETADELARFLKHMNHPALGVNFDPANMVLYNKGNPIEALTILAPWIKHIHIKDATLTPIPGEWGTEVIWGTGDINDTEFLDALTRIDYTGAVAIEREAGDTRMADIRVAIQKLDQYSDSN